MEMRYPLVHTFLKWFGPACVATVAGGIGLIAGLAQSFPKVRLWAEQEFDDWWPAMSAPWVILTGVILIALYLCALIYTGARLKKNAVALRLPEERYDRSNGVTVTSYNQLGGQTAHTIVNREPNPVPARKLSAEQAEAIRSVLISSNIKGAIMEVQFASNEHAHFSAQIVSIFEKCGWTRKTFCIPSREKPHGMRLAYQDEKSNAYLVAVEALRSAGLEFREGTYSGEKADVSLDVGILEMTPFQRAADKWPE